MTFGASIWALSQNPFAEPFVMRGAQSARVALDRAMAETIDVEWLAPRLGTALAQRDPDLVALYLELADEYAVVLPNDLRANSAEYLQAENGFIASAGDCAACAVNMANCQRLAHVASCAIPVEMTPIGDLNALRRAGVDWVSGEEVDRLEVGLALAGLGATGLAVGSGGTTLPVKAGASTLRMAKNLGALTPGFSNVVLGVADIAVSWDEIPDYLLGRVPLDAVADTKKLAELSAVATDLDKIRVNTSAAETLSMLRHIDDVGDARALALLSEAKGVKTRHTLQALGKSRSFRLLHRLSDLALLSIGLLTALALQFISLAASFGLRLFRPSRG